MPRWPSFSLPCGHAVRCLWPPFGGFLALKVPPTRPQLVCYVPVTGLCSFVLGAQAQPRPPAPEGSVEEGPVDVKMIFSPFPAEMDFQPLGLWLFVLISCSFSCLFLLHSFAQCLHRESSFLCPEENRCP